MRYAMIIFLVMVSKLAFSQTSDSIRLILNQTTGKQKKIELLFELSDYFSNNYLDSALFYCQKAKELSQQLGAKNQEARALKLEGNINFRKGNFDLVEQKYKAALDLFLEKGNIKEAGNIFNNLGLLYQKTGRQKEAFKVLEKALNLFEQSKIDSLKSGALINLALLHFRVGNYPETEMFLNAALEIAEKYGQNTSIANISNNLGALFKEYGDYEKTLFFYNKAIKYRLKTDDFIGVAASYNNLGILYEELGEYALAAKFILKGLKEREKYGSFEMIAASYNKLADIYAIWGKYNVALDYYNKAIEKQEKANDKYYLASSLVGMASVYYKMDMHKKGLDFYEEAADIFKKMDNKRELADIYSNIGRIYGIKLRYFSLAMNYFDTSETIYTGLKSNNGLASLYYNKAEVLIEQNNLKEAIDLLKKSIALNPFGQIELYKNYKSLSKACNQLGDYKNAHKYLSISLKYKDSIDLSAQELEDFKYETLLSDEKNRQIMELKEQQKSFEKEQKRQIILFATMISVLLVFLILGAFFVYKKKKYNV